MSTKRPSRLKFDILRTTFDNEAVEKIYNKIFKLIEIPTNFHKVCLENKYYVYLSQLPVTEALVSLSGSRGDGRFLRCDAEDYERLAEKSWTLSHNTKDLYEMIISGKYSPGRLVLNGETKNQKMVDHISGNVFDVRKQNLRFATAGQNSANKNKTRGASVFKGVSIVRGKWQASISSKRKMYYLGVFESEIEAGESIR